MDRTGRVNRSKGSVQAFSFRTSALVEQYNRFLPTPAKGISSIPARLGVKLLWVHATRNDPHSAAVPPESSLQLLAQRVRGISGGSAAGRRRGGCEWRITGVMADVSFGRHKADVCPISLSAPEKTATADPEKRNCAAESPRLPVHLPDQHSCPRSAPFTMGFNTLILRISPAVSSNPFLAHRRGYPHRPSPSTFRAAPLS
jgi:hypothetical protein